MTGYLMAVLDAVATLALAVLCLAIVVVTCMSLAWHARMWASWWRSTKGHPAEEHAIELAREALRAR